MFGLGPFLAALAPGLFAASTPAAHHARAAFRQLGKRAASVGRRKTRLVHPRNAGYRAGAEFLAQRSLHPGHSSSLRKPQRAFRIAGQSFTPEGTGKGRGH